MAEVTKPKHGTICWNELATGDVETAKNFYQELFGWSLEKSKILPVIYTQIQLDGRAFGGIIQMTKEWGDPPPPAHWTTYIGVDNIEETVEQIKQKGGGICIPPFEIPDFGKLSIVNDPSGAMFSLIQFADDLK